MSWRDTSGCESRLSSPCVDSRKTVCPKRDYPDCMKTCQGIDEFQNNLLTEDCSMQASCCDTNFSVNIHRNGVCARSRTGRGTGTGA
jgi:hypothetical protein